MDFKQFDNIKKDYEHRFVKADPGILHQLFGTEELIPFWIADMDFSVAKPIADELQRLVDRGIFAYEFASDGVFTAIVNWYKTRHQLELNKSHFLQVTGVLTGISLLIRELTKPGDGVLIQTPVYHQFATLIKAADRTIIKNPLKIVDGSYEMNLVDLEQKIQSEKVKLMLLCNPHNPVGRVWNKHELQHLIDLANKYEMTIISDEMHSDIVYSGHTFNSILSIDHENHIAMLGSPAKTFGMQSISNGYICIPDEKQRNDIKKIIQAMYLDHGNAMSTFATIAAYQHGGEWLNEMISYLEKTIAWIADFLENELPAVKMFPVEGTYQVWLDFRALNLNEEQLKELVIGKAKLGLTPGNWFDSESALFMRMNIASPLSKIQAAFQQLQLVCHENL